MSNSNLRKLTIRFWNNTLEMVRSLFWIPNAVSTSNNSTIVVRPSLTPSTSKVYSKKKSLLNKRMKRTPISWRLSKISKNLLTSSISVSTLNTMNPRETSGSILISNIPMKKKKNRSTKRLNLLSRKSSLTPRATLVLSSTSRAVKAVKRILSCLVSRRLSRNNKSLNGLSPSSQSKSPWKISRLRTKLLRLLLTLMSLLKIPITALFSSTLRRMVKILWSSVLSVKTVKKSKRFLKSDIRLPSS